MPVQRVDFFLGEIFDINQTIARTFKGRDNLI